MKRFVEKLVKKVAVKSAGACSAAWVYQPKMPAVLKKAKA